MRSRDKGHGGQTATLGRAGKIGVIGLLGLVLIVGHWLFWYAPRERGRTPAAGDAPARLLVAPEYDSALWVPYPHQNLGVLEEAVGSWRPWVESVSRVAGIPPPDVPRFGPFALPPARELTVATSRDGKELTVAARVYPAVAVIARLAGAVASNPWLSGGSLEPLGGRGGVRWEGTLWLYSTRGGGERLLGGGPPPLDLPPSLAVVRSSQPSPYRPAGLLGLRRLGEDLELSGLATPSGEGELGTTPSWNPEAPWNSEVSEADAPVAMAWSRGGGMLGVRPTAALLTLSTESTLLLGKGLRLKIPGGAVLWVPEREEPKGEESGSGSSQRFRLPTERLPSLLRGSMEKGEAHGLAIVASGDAALRLAHRWSGPLARALEEEGGGSELWIRPGAAYKWVSQVVEALEAVPLVRERHLQPWKDWQTVLAPFSPWARIRVLEDPREGAFVVRFERRPAASSPGSPGTPVD